MSLAVSVARTRPTPSPQHSGHFACGESVWSQDFDVTWDEADHDRGHAEFYVVHTDGFRLDDSDWTDDERVDITASRWWTVDELAATEEPFEPVELPDLVRRAARSRG